MNTSFDARQVIKSALLAGNDLLYTGNIVASGDPDSYTTLVRTHDFFVQKYNEDTAFQQRVDEAVLRVLTLKYILYPNFLISDTLTNTTDLDLLGVSEQQIFEIARQSVTLVSPGIADIDAVLPEPPALNERIVFISDQVVQAQCSTCPDQSLSLAKNLRNAVERLYGPKAGEQVQSYRLMDYSFDDLEKLLNGENAPANMLTDIQSANWLVISFTHFQAESHQSALFKRFFLEKPELTRNKKVIGFAFNAPYYLDATDISKLTAYYAVYSKIPVFVDVAARILFREITPEGILPVSVTSVGYDLIVATTPDPNQIIPLLVDNSNLFDSSTLIPSASPEVPLIYKVGDTIPLRTGIIVDHNGHPVPDGTVVRFLIDTRSASGSIEQIETQTTNGIAQTTYRIQSIGKFELKVTADPAVVSQILSLDITEGGGQITSFEPTTVPTASPFATDAPESSETPETPPLSSHERGITSVGDWLIATLVIFGVVGGFFTWGRQKQKQNWTKVPFLAGVTGYLVYVYFCLGLPGTMRLILSGKSGLIFIFIFVGSITGGGLGLFWNRLERKREAKTTV
jgi:beta-N-acetylhexosaminidase